MTSTLRAFALLFAFGLALAPAPGWAQEDYESYEPYGEGDDPIPYPGQQEEPPTDDRGLRELPPESDIAADFRDASESEGEVTTRYALLDDPNLGLGGELLVGTLLVDSARGQLVEPGLGWGLRFNWEFGRLLTQEGLREALFTDLTWTYGALREGTREIFVDANYHFFTVAPAYQLFVDAQRRWGFYGQLGGGLAYQFSALHHDGSESTIAGVKPVFQYGVGFRGRPQLSADPNAHLTVRVELTRFRRGYLNDTLIATSVGASF